MVLGSICDIYVDTKLEAPHAHHAGLWCLCAGDELEYLRPNVYRNVARQLNITVASESIVSDAFLAVAADIFSTGRSTSRTTRGL